MVFYSRIESISRFRKYPAEICFQSLDRRRFHFSGGREKCASDKFYRMAQGFASSFYRAREQRRNCGESNLSWSQRDRDSLRNPCLIEYRTRFRSRRSLAEVAPLPDSAPRNHCSQGISEAKFVPESYPASRMPADGRKSQDWPVSRPRFSSLDRVHKYFLLHLCWDGSSVE